MFKLTATEAAYQRLCSDLFDSSVQVARQRLDEQYKAIFIDREFTSVPAGKFITMPDGVYFVELNYEPPKPAEQATAEIVEDVPVAQ